MLDFDELEEIETHLRASFPDVKTDQVTDVKVPPGQELRIFLISDLHVDYKQNKEWMYRCLQSLSHESSDGRRFFDCLLLPGDLCTSEDLFEEVMKTLKARFHKVFFCFGNHEAWIRGEKKGNTPAKDSFEKLERIHEICKDLGVYTSPVRLLHGSSNPGSRPSSNGVSSIILLPLLSWYHSSWDTERDLPTDLQPPMDPGQRISDFRQCRWSSLEGEKGFAFGQGGVTSTHIAEYFAQRNEVWIKEVLELQSREGGEILSYSHFCPRQELILEKRFSYDQHVPKISGSSFLEQQIRRVNPKCHVFGHTHVAWDTCLDGIRYVHWPLGNIKEQNGQTKMQHYSGFLLLYDAPRWSPIQFTHWGYFYDFMEKRQGSSKLAPWVSFGYASMYPEMKEALKQRNLLSAKVDGPDGMSPFFPGGALNNNGAFWLRHASANLRWRLPPLGLEALRFPCENPGCLLCRFTAEQEAKEDVSTVG